MRTPAEEAEFARTIAVLFETLPPRKPVTPVQLRRYSVALSELTAEQVQQAGARALRECTFVPAPHELLKLAGVMDEADRALLAWQVVVDNTGIGSYRSVDFDDPLINATIRSMGGWVALLALSGEKFDVWARKSFVETYAGFARSGVNGDACRPLPGLSDTGTHEVTAIDGTTRTANLPGPTVVVTGLPALPGATRKRIDSRADVPRVELKKP